MKKEIIIDKVILFNIYKIPSYRFIYMINSLKYSK